MRYLSLTARSDEEFVEEVRSLRPGVPLVACSDEAERAFWQQAMDRWARGEEVPVPLDLEGLTAFQRRVLEELRRIPRGQTVSYAELARRCGRPRAARAVGQVVARNPVPLWIPCHRVVASDGSLGGYSGGGPHVKRRLLELEGGLPAARAGGGRVDRQGLRPV